ncbi:hypothetical protein HYQ46_002348 [Verticillium longisporum]|nr:hypothetical protein HYQ46_002348 [Verticillium longisporum]
MLPAAASCAQHHLPIRMRRDGDQTPGQLAEMGFDMSIPSNGSSPQIEALSQCAWWWCGAVCLVWYSPLIDLLFSSFAIRSSRRDHYCAPPPTVSPYLSLLFGREYKAHPPTAYYSSLLLHAFALPGTSTLSAE